MKSVHGNLWKLTIPLLEKTIVRVYYALFQWPCPIPVRWYFARFLHHALSTDSGRVRSIQDRKKVRLLSLTTFMELTWKQEVMRVRGRIGIRKPHSLLWRGGRRESCLEIRSAKLSGWTGTGTVGEAPFQQIPPGVVSRRREREREATFLFPSSSLWFLKFYSRFHRRNVRSSSTFSALRCRIITCHTVGILLGSKYLILLLCDINHRLPHARRVRVLEHWSKFITSFHLIASLSYVWYL